MQPFYWYINWKIIILNWDYEYLKRPKKIVATDEIFNHNPMHLRNEKHKEETIFYFFLYKGSYNSTNSKTAVSIFLGIDQIFLGGKKNPQLSGWGDVSYYIKLFKNLWCLWNFGSCLFNFIVEIGEFRLNIIMGVDTCEQKKIVLYYVHQREHEVHFPETFPPPRMEAWGEQNKPAFPLVTKLLNNIIHRHNSFKA